MREGIPKFLDGFGEVGKEGVWAVVHKLKAIHEGYGLRPLQKITK